MAINKYPFTATTVAANILTANPARRRLYIQSFGPPDANDTNTVWVDFSGGTAVALQSWQLQPGAVWNFGGSDDYIAPLQTRFPSCPTGAISVITGASTHQGVIYEWT